VPAAGNRFLVPNRVLWSPEAASELSAAVLSEGPDEVAHLVWSLENRPLRTGWGRPDPDAVMELYVQHLSVVYRLTGAGTAIEVLEVRRKGLT
jgi:hypothetical protein